MIKEQYGYGFYFKCIQLAISKYIDEHLKEFGLTRSQLDVLYYLHQHANEHVCQKDIQDHLHISNPTVTGLLDRLEQKEYIVRIKGTVDKRVRYIEITEKAVQLKDNIKKIMTDLEKNMIAGFTPSQQDELCVLLDRVLHNLETEDPVC